MIRRLQKIALNPAQIHFAAVLSLMLIVCTSIQSVRVLVKSTGVVVQFVQVLVQSVLVYKSNCICNYGIRCLELMWPVLLAHDMLVIRCLTRYRSVMRMFLSWILDSKLMLILTVDRRYSIRHGWRLVADQMVGQPTYTEVAARKCIWI